MRQWAQFEKRLEKGDATFLDLTPPSIPAYLDKIEQERAGGKAGKVVDDEQMELELAMSETSMRSDDKK